ncbi:MAG: DMT family transporter [Pyrinomonadaceae bacterium]
MKTLNDNAHAEDALRQDRFLTYVPPIIFILAAALVWSTGGLFIKATQFSAFALSSGRALLAGLTVAFITRRERFGFNRVTLCASILYAALLLLFVLATKLTTATNAIFLQYTAPVYVLIFEPIFFKEKFRGRDVMVVLVCIVGMSLFFVGQLRPDDVKGNVAALASGVCFAGFMLLLRHRRAREVNRASAVIYGNFLLAAVCSFALVAEAPTATMKDWLLVAYLGIIQLSAGYALFTLGMARGVRSLDAGIVGYIEPVLNPLWVFFFLGERPSRWAIVGGAIIVGAVATHTVLSARRNKSGRHMIS